MLDKIKKISEKNSESLFTIKFEDYSEYDITPETAINILEKYESLTEEDKEDFRERICCSAQDFCEFIENDYVSYSDIEDAYEE